MPTPDPIGEVNLVLADYQASLTAYASLLALYTAALSQITALQAGIAAETDEASTDLQTVIDGASAFVAANPPPVAPVATAAATQAVQQATPSTPPPATS